jgi:hypothetical protein
MTTNSDIIQSLKPAIFVKQLLAKIEAGAIIFTHPEPNLFRAYETLSGACSDPPSIMVLWEYFVTRIPNQDADIIVLDVAKNRKSFFTLSSTSTIELASLYEYLIDGFDPNIDDMIHDLDLVKTADQIIVNRSSGGVRVGGSSPVFRTLPQPTIGNGGVVLSGFGLQSSNFAPSGGVSVGGQARFDANFIGKGGILAGGSSMWVDPSAHEVGHGGASVGGSAIVSSPIIYHNTAFGGVMVSGTTKKTLNPYNFTSMPNSNNGTHDQGWVGDYTNINFDLDDPNTGDPLRFVFESIPPVYDPANRNFSIGFGGTVPVDNSVIPLNGLTFGVVGTPADINDHNVYASFGLQGIDVNGNFQNLFFLVPILGNKVRYTPFISPNGGSITGPDGSITSNVTGADFVGTNLTISFSLLASHPPGPQSDWSIGAMGIEIVGNTFVSG